MASQGAAASERAAGHGWLVCSQATLIGTLTSPDAVWRTWSISSPTIAMTLPSNLRTISTGRSFVSAVHHTCA